MIDEISQLIDDIGYSVTFRKNAVSAYNPATSQASASAADESAKAHFQSYKSFEVNGTNIVSGDFKMCLKAKDLSRAPNTDDQIIYNSVTHNIVSVKPYHKGSETIVYILQVRK